MPWHLMDLHGWCKLQMDEELKIVHEFMSNGSLDTHSFVSTGNASVHLTSKLAQPSLTGDMKSKQLSLSLDLIPSWDSGLPKLQGHDKKLNQFRIIYVA
jgi:hypothetical protein